MTRLAVFTGLPWVVAQLIPDLFTGALLLVLWLVGFRWAGGGEPSCGTMSFTT